MRSFLLLMAGALVVFIFGCDQVGGLIGQSPGKVVIQYMEATTAGRYSDVYDLLSTADREAVSREEYVRQFSTSKVNILFREFLSKHSTYKIESLTETGDRGNVIVATTYPDITPVANEFIGPIIAAAFSENKQKKIEEQFLLSAQSMKEKMKKGELSTITDSTIVELIKESDGWKIYTNESQKVKEGQELEAKVKALKDEAKKFEKQKVEKRKKDAKTRALIAEANKLKREKKLASAKEKYNKALQLDSESIEAKKGIKEIDEEISNFEEKQAYLYKIKLYDFEVKYYDAILEGRVPGVKFKLKNAGNKILNKVEVTVYFKDAQGGVIHEIDYRPVNISSWNFMEDNKPLKPNYIWQLEQDKFFTAKSVPSEWKEGSASVKITDIEFSE